MNLALRLSNWFYHFKCRYISKYTIVKAKSLQDDVYQPPCRVLPHVMMQILSDCVDSIDDEELIRIDFWWKNIFLQKSKIILETLFVPELESKKFMRTLAKSDALVRDFNENFHYLVDNMGKLK